MPLKPMTEVDKELERIRNVETVYDFWFSEKQQEVLKITLRSRENKFKGEIYTEMVVRGKSPSNWDDFVHIGTGTLKDATNR